MVVFGQNFEIPVGRTELKGKLKLYSFAGESIALMLSGGSERSPTVLLNLEQARAVQAALGELIASCETGNEQSKEV